MVNKMKYVIEMECNVEGEVDKLREVATSARESVDYATTDIQGVEGVNVTVKAIRTYEEEIDLGEDEAPLV